MQIRRDLSRIFAAAVSAVEPTKLVERNIRRTGDRIEVDAAGVSWDERALVVGAGKAAARMAAGCEQAIGPDQVHGLVIVADGCGVALRGVEVAEAAHPLPDQRGLRATERICRLLAEQPEGPILCLLSGGASSLLVRPRTALSLQDKVECGQLLYRSGADIEEVNTVRKHLSLVKGGGLLRFARRRPIVTLVLSDVIGDDPAVIGSGPTVADPSTFGDAWEVIERFGLDQRLPPAVRGLLQAGLRGEAAESVKPDDPETQSVFHAVIGTNRMALEAAAAEARHCGYEATVLGEPLAGDTTQAAGRWIRAVQAHVAAGRTGRRCVIAGGETTVHVAGAGKGGRNQEFALALAGTLSGSEIAVLSAGTDGIDGPTDAAGAFVDGTTLARSASQGLDPEVALRANNSYVFFDSLGDLFRCGPTGTNVMDIKIALSVPAPRHP